MKPLSTVNLATIAMLWFFISCAGTPQQCFTGLREMEEYDISREFDTTGKGKPNIQKRPVRYEIYYPSDCKPSSATITYGDILDMYDQRIYFDRPKDSCRKTSLEIARTIGQYLKMKDPDKMLTVQTGIYKDLPLPKKKFPLIIYAAGMNGGSWENTVLFDNLVKAGFVVAAVYSVGKYPGFMSSSEDLDEQVRDIMFVKRKMKALPFIENNKIGLLSWSMGGSASTKAAMLSNDFRCILSYDGTEIHYYGKDKDWDRQFDEIKNIPPFIPERISVPYMYLSSDRSGTRDSAYVFPQHISSNEKFYLELKGATHESFSSIFPIAKATEPDLSLPDSNQHLQIPSITIAFFEQFLQKKNTSVPDSISKMMRNNPGMFSTEFPAESHSDK